MVSLYIFIVYQLFDNDEPENLDEKTVSFDMECNGRFEIINFQNDKNHHELKCVNK